MRHTLKTPYRDGTTHIVLEPLEPLARLAAPVPSPRMHLTRDHGVFALHSRLRVRRGMPAAGLTVRGQSASGPGLDCWPVTRTAFARAGGLNSLSASHFLSGTACRRVSPGYHLTGPDPPFGASGVDRSNQEYATMWRLLFAVVGALVALPSSAADVSASVAISQPGFYGQINIGDVPRPVVIYAEPVWVQRPRKVVYVEPIYLRVPPGHEKHWSKHCSSYNACGRPVYFVREDWYQTVYVPRHKGQDYYARGEGRDDDRGNGNGNGKDKGRH